ncbi:MAG: DUF3313 family protein [Planctomycetes bacterium]|nr:DUF3313 family protein [Planctomycetota bacterium]
MVLRSSRSALIALALLLATSCSETAKQPAAPADDFLGFGSELAPVEDSVWDQSWRAPDVKWQNWTELHIAPIVADHLGEAAWCNDCALDELPEKRSELAKLFHQKIETAFREDADHMLEPVDAVGAKTVVLELAIIDVVPARSWFNARGTAPAGLSGHGSIAIEGRILDGKTGRLLSTFADREDCAADLLAGANADWCCHAPLLFDRWATRLVGLAHAAKEGRLGSTSSVPTHSW